MKEIIVKVTPDFERKSKKLMSEEAKEELYDYLLLNPMEGAIIKGTGGLRKLRWKTGLNDKGKSGGVRVIYHYSDNLLIVLITLYSKTQKENLTQEECNAFKRLTPLLIEKYKGEIL